MASQGRSSIRFTVNRRQYDLARATVESRLVDVAPDAIRKHAVRVNGVWFPVLQAFELASGIPRSEFMSYTARRHLVALGFEVRGDVDHRASRAVGGDEVQGRVPSTWIGTPAQEADEQWHTEGNVQAAVVTHLVGAGWRIFSVANTATKEHGIDVVAGLRDEVVGIEVKGFPSRGYADPARAGETKRSSPSTQAGHWYSQAVLAAMRLRGKKPDWRSVIALPDFPRYRDLHAETMSSLSAAQIEVWWVDRSGSVQGT
ncbi:hypothetical protein F0U44_21975 [Nocardioides humilatus]|uniref:Uncharacterized protein n=1 Tax=Nocardioides humilatus TaxID=2607660 RepID=A0A5B1L6F0_9ACTN|nr:hypothetical protein [Nocardioides humilatus]KAA1415350.1 hypothetical protein F0U44_21975 [Nocardioides humilatus]